LEEEEDMVKALRTLKILDMQEVDDVFHQIPRDL
jgi:protein-L-isoaspartate O-methyltransferase